MGFGGPKPAAPVPPPPPPSPAQQASAAVQQSGAAQRAIQAAQAGAGFDGTIASGSQGAAAATTSGKALLGS